jgi:hypothetical protein
MGFHYVNFSLMEDQYVDPFKPEILLYAPGKHSDRKLVGVEYTLVALGYDSEPDDPDALDRTPIPFFGNEDGPPLPPGWVWYTFPPTIFGQEFDSDSGYPMPSHGSPLDPYHYDLHFWVHKKNPNGAFEPWNPKVSCE